MPTFKSIGGFTYYSEDRDQSMVAIEVAGRKNEDGSNNPLFVTQTQFDQKSKGLFDEQDIIGCEIVAEFFRKGETLPARDGEEGEVVTDSGVILKSFGIKLTPEMQMNKMRVSAELKANGLSVTKPVKEEKKTPATPETPPADDSTEETPDLVKETEKAQAKN